MIDIIRLFPTYCKYFVNYNKSALKIKKKVVAHGLMYGLKPLVFKLLRERDQQWLGIKVNITHRISPSNV